MQVHYFSHRDILFVGADEKDTLTRILPTIKDILVCVYETAPVLSLSHSLKMTAAHHAVLTIEADIYVEDLTVLQTLRSQISTMITTENAKISS